MVNPVKPYREDSSKKEQVEEMFNNISKRYDLTNSIISLGIHHYWRKKVVQILKPYKPKIILDLATGTASLAIKLSELQVDKIIAADFADKMLEIAQKKINEKQLSSVIQLAKEDVENLSFSNNTFDVVTISFGIRNVENYSKGLDEIYRVLKNNGVLLILEFTTPKNLVIRGIYNFYFKCILPIIAWLITKDKKAYDYLPKSVSVFPQYEQLCNILKTHQFKECQYVPLSFGIATIYVAKK